MRLAIDDVAATKALAAKVAAELQPGFIVYLQGELGAGKTTFVQGLLQSLGYAGIVKSPTYTLVEPYSIAGKEFYHFDLYRINHPQALEEMGLRDYFDGVAICLLEWPEHGDGLLPTADIIMTLDYADIGRTVDIQAHTAVGEQIIKQLQSHYSSF